MVNYKNLKSYRCAATASYLDVAATLPALMQPQFTCCCSLCQRRCRGANSNAAIISTLKSEVWSLKSPRHNLNVMEITSPVDRDFQLQLNLKYILHVTCSKTCQLIDNHGGAPTSATFCLALSRRRKKKPNDLPLVVGWREDLIIIRLSLYR